MKIGILALQGAFREHVSMLEKLGVKTILVKQVEDLENIDGLIVPGGESTTIGKLLKKYKLIQPIKKLSKAGIPIYGSCAGLILLAKKIKDTEQPLIGVMNLDVTRNAYGRQKESFEAELNIAIFGNKPFKGIFIRAPRINKISNSAKALARFEGRPVMVREKNLLVTSFHPELTNDNRIHQYFIGMIKERYNEKRVVS